MTTAGCRPRSTRGREMGRPRPPSAAGAPSPPTVLARARKKTECEDGRRGCPVPRSTRQGARGRVADQRRGRAADGAAARPGRPRGPWRGSAKGIGEGGGPLACRSSSSPPTRLAVNSARLVNIRTGEAAAAVPIICGKAPSNPFHSAKGCGVLLGRAGPTRRRLRRTRRLEPVRRIPSHRTARARECRGRGPQPPTRARGSRKSGPRAARGVPRSLSTRRPHPCRPSQ